MKKNLRSDIDVSGLGLSIGDKTNINHEGCSAGEDRKQRQYIWRTKYGYNWYCHHCSESGFVPDNARKNTFTKRKTPTGVGTNSSKRCISLPSDATGVLSEWPADARVWIRKYGITDTEVAAYGIMYSERFQRVILPCWNKGELVSFQTRRIFSTDERPKYLSYGSKDSVFHVEHKVRSRVLCIVEDVLSAIKVGRFVDSLALRKASMSDRELAWVVQQGYEKFVIFLDDDNAQVKKNQIVLKNKLENYGSVNIIHTNGRDPKECSDKELEELVL